MRNYDDFVTHAFIGYGIPPEILRVVQTWVQKECGPEDFWGVHDDQGYAELADITTLDQAMSLLAQDLAWQRVDGTRAYNKYIRCAGGSPGHGVYRIALRAYYLMHNEAAPCP